jgi:TP901 family phage tail tape measure protein
VTNNPETKVTFKVFNKEFTKAMGEMKSESSKLRQEFILQSEQLKENGSESDQLRNKIDYLIKAQQLAQQRISATSDQLQKAKQLYGENSNEVDSLAKQLTSAQIAEQKLQNEISNVNRELAEQTDVAKKATQALSNTGERLQSVGQTMGTTFATATVAIGGGLGLAVKKSMDFEAQLSRVGAIADATDGEMKSLRQSALDLGASTSKSATEIAQGQEALAALGFTANEIVGAMPGVISAAEASGSDMAQTAEVMASTLNIFGMEASKATDVADVLAKTANISAANLTDMQYALKYAGPPAAALGISFEELSASIGIMTNAGMKGEQAGTTLRGALLSLLDPSVENSKLMETMGVQITDASGDFVGLSKLIENLSTSMAGMTDTQKAANLASLVGTEAVSGMLSLMAAGPAEIDKMTASLQNSAGASAEAAAKMKDNLKGTMDELSGSIETLAISVGTSLTPILEKIAGIVQSVTEKFNNLSPSTQKFIALGAGLAFVLTGLAATIGFLMMGIGGLISAIGAIGLPVAAIITAIALFGAGVAAAYLKIEPFREGVQSVFRKVQQIISTVMFEVTQFFQDKILEIRLFWASNGEQIKKAFSNVFNAIAAIIKFIMPAIEFVIKSVWGNIKGVINGALNIILGLVKTFAALFTGDWKGVWDGIQQIFVGAFELLWNGFQLLFVGRLIKGIGSLFSLMSTGVKSGLTKVGSFFKGGIEAVRGLWTKGAPQIWKIIDDMVNKIVDFVAKLPGNLKSLGKDAIEGLINGIKNMAGKAAKAAGDVAKGIADTVIGFFQIHSPSRLMHEVGGHVTQGLANGISSKQKTAEAAARETAAAAKKGFEQEFRNIDYRLDAKKISADQAIKELEKLKVEYKNVPNAVEKSNKAIYEINKKYATENSKIAKEQFEKEVKNIKDKHDLNKITLQQELKMWQDLGNKYKAGSTERIQTEKEAAKIREALLKQQYETEKSLIEKKKYFNQLSLTEELKMYESNMAKYKKGTEERLFYEREIYRVKLEINTKLNLINEEYVNKVAALNQKLIDEEKRLTNEYNLAVDNRSKALYSFSGIFDEITQKSDVSGQQLMENLKAQVTTFSEWSKNIALLASKGIDQGLLDELRNMGPKAAGEIAALNTLSDTQLQEYVKLWKDKNALARTEAEKELQGMKLDTQTRITELRTQTQSDLELYKNEWILKIKEIRTGATGELDPLKASLKGIGMDSIQGLMDGMNQMVGPLMDQAQAIADTVSETIKSALDIHSPSRVLEWMGQMTGAGLAQGMKKSIDSVKSMAEQMALATVPRFEPPTTTSPSGSANMDKFVQNLHIYSPQALSPSETARQNRLALQQAAFQLRR